MNGPSAAAPSTDFNRALCYAATTTPVPVTCSGVSVVVASTSRPTTAAAADAESIHIVNDDLSLQLRYRRHSPVKSPNHLLHWPESVQHRSGVRLSVRLCVPWLTWQLQQTRYIQYCAHQGPLYSRPTSLVQGLVKVIVMKLALHDITSCLLYTSDAADE